ncbi:hypothetical protein [Idiomarina sp. UBA3992]|jgi:hypothetical protein|uniref:hypothetical protein n=1 Tax=Idiomarina sp. UBA3992 TaxID=1946643 RepID=UPI00257BDFEA|nr:hypothetical protein [Idiomarina sp. UBA3992]
MSIVKKVSVVAIMLAGFSSFNASAGCSTETRLKCDTQGNCSIEIVIICPFQSVA